MVRDYGGRAVELDLAGLQTDIGIMPARLLSVLEATKTWLAQGGRDPSNLYAVFHAAEARKGARARLSQKPNASDRRAQGVTDRARTRDGVHQLGRVSWRDIVGRYVWGAGGGV